MALFNNSKYIFRLFGYFFLFFTLNVIIYAQNCSLIGQFWFTTEYIKEQSESSYQLGYIPTFSSSYHLSSNSKIDLEWAYRLENYFNGNTLIENIHLHHRYWGRYSSDKIEVRIGLQKIVFGPSQLLRSLSWFDTIDLKDPKGQTKGVDAFRLRFFPSNLSTLWAWAIKNKTETLSYGGRGEVSTKMGEWGITFHKDPSKSSQYIGMLNQSPVLITSSHTRIGLDYRYDGLLGVWFEGAAYYSKKANLIGEDRCTLSTLGIDYTIPLGDGILAMLEIHKVESWSSINTKSNRSDTNSAIMVTLPFGMFHSIMFFSNLDLNENQNYNHLRWSSTFDRYSINGMVSINPNNIANSLGLMFIYNH